jgi:transcriptional regulator with XRE-family HTH domain
MLPLEKWLKVNKTTAQEMAAALGLDHSTIYRLLSGERLPRLEIAFMIQYYTDGEVTPESFLKHTPAGYVKLFKANARQAKARRAAAKSVHADADRATGDAA